MDTFIELKPLVNGQVTDGVAACDAVEKRSLRGATQLLHNLSFKVFHQFCLELVMYVLRQ